MYAVEPYAVGLSVNAAGAVAQAEGILPRSSTLSSRLTAQRIPERLCDERKRVGGYTS